jgi:hypothetical protein
MDAAALDLPPLPETSPGPWRVYRAETTGRPMVCAKGGATLAICFDKFGAPAWENALVMRAAPELRDALVGLLCAPDFAAFEAAVDQGRAVLRKLATNRAI